MFKLQKCRHRIPNSISSLPSDSVVLRSAQVKKVVVLCNNSKINKLDNGAFNINKKIIVDMNLRYNHLSYIDMFSTLINLNLNELNLMNNEFTLISSVYFETLNFKILRLDNNNISIIEKLTFITNVELTELYMSNNSLVTIPKGIFEKNSKIRIINFDNNKINSILGSWEHLYSIETMSFKNNKLLYFQESIFKRKYTTIEIIGNDFKCSCDMVWTLTFKFYKLPPGIKNEKCKRNEQFTMFDILDKGSNKHSAAKLFIKDLQCLNGNII